MLREIECEKFISNNKPRGKIEFYEGLNTIRGGNRSDNSVGKSTFLLMIDFCFGGESLWKKTNLTSMVEQHDIKFMFEFDKQYYFVRSPYDPSKVWLCDDKYEHIEEWTLDRFKQFLYEKYELNFDSVINFRKVVGRYIRAFGKGNCDEQFPLQDYQGEGKTRSIDILVKTFNLYQNLKHAQDEKNKTDEDKKAVAALKSTGVFNIRIPSKEQHERNVTELIALRRKRDAFLRDADYSISETEKLETEESLDIYRDINQQKRRRRRLIARRKLAKQNLEIDNHASLDNIERLTDYFTDVNIERLQRVQAYHDKLGMILRDELQEEVDLLDNLIKGIDEAIKRLEGEQRQKGKPVNISQDKLNELSNMDTEISKLAEEVRLYEENQKYDAESRKKIKH